MSGKPVIIGIDLGSADSYVAYVGKSVVDIVQNEVSKRATASLIGFTDRERLLGDSALAQIRGNAKNTCRNVKHLLGRKIDAPDVQIEHFWSTSKLCECADGHAGYDVNYKGESRKMSSIEVAAMFFFRLKELSEKWCEGKVSDCVIAVPSSFSDVQRQAVLDASKVANLSVLRLMNEHTATALAYGIYRSNDFDAEKTTTVAFCSMGHSMFSVCIVQFVKGKLSILCEKSAKVGSRDLDGCMMREFAEQFKKKTGGLDALANKKAFYKLEDATAKAKKTLSANSEADVFCEFLVEEEDFKSTIQRADLEKMCAPAMAAVQQVLEEAKAMAGLTNDQIDSVEIVGGGSRVPWVKKLCSEAFEKELSTTTNQEESCSRGCALQAAILSPLYKVRDFKVEDTTRLSINVGWLGAGQQDKGEDGEVAAEGADGELKTSTVFPAGTLMNTLKMLTFHRKGPFDIMVEYTDPALLPPGTPKSLGNYRVELPPQSDTKKVKVRTRINLHGMFAVEGAQMEEEEEYEEVTKEKRELPEDQQAATPAAEGAAATLDADAKPAEGDAGGEKDKAAAPKTEKKYEWVEVKKMKKRTKKTDLKVTKTGAPGLSDADLQKLMDAESAMQADMADIIETDARRNDLESYIFNMRDKISEGNEYGAFVSSADRDSFSSDLNKAEDWLYDNPDGTTTLYLDKLDELKRIGDPIVWRFKESGMRAEWITAVTGTVSNYRAAAEQPGEKFGHIAPEKLASIVTAANELDTWLLGLQAKQNALLTHEKPVLICVEMEKKNQELAKMADEILKEPKPAPPKEEKTEEAPKEGEKPEEKAPEAKKDEPSSAADVD